MEGHHEELVDVAARLADADGYEDRDHLLRLIAAVSVELFPIAGKDHAALIDLGVMPFALHGKQLPCGLVPEQEVRVSDVGGHDVVDDLVTRPVQECARLLESRHHVLFEWQSLLSSFFELHAKNDLNEDSTCGKHTGGRGPAPRAV